MKDKILIIKQGREYFARGGLDGVYKKLYAYEQTADKPEKVIAVDKVLEIIDKHAGHGGNDDYCDGYDVACLDIKQAIMALKGGEQDAAV